MSKVKNLPSHTVLAEEDVFYVVDESVGTNGGRKITKADLKTNVSLTSTEVKDRYESNSDTNAFTDAEKTKLAGIETGATADQNASEVPYDNTVSGLAATEVKSALDEINLATQADFKPSIVSGRILHYTGGTARFDDVFFTVVTGDILLDPNITLGEVYVDLDGLVKQTASGVNAPPLSIVFAKFSTDLNDIISLTDERVKNTQNLVRGIVSDVRDVRAGAAASTGASGRLSDAMHKHPVLTATAIDITSTSEEGDSIELARANHKHKGVHSIKANSDAQRFNDLSLKDGNGVSVTDDGSGNFTIDTTIGPNELKVTQGAGLTANYTGGKVRINGTVYTIVAGSLVVATGATNGRIYVDVDGVVKSTTSTNSPPNSVSLAIFSSSGLAITALSENRTLLNNNIQFGSNSDIATVGVANAAGSTNKYADAGHAHDHGNQTNPTHHAAATTSANGFMSSADKTKLDAMVFGFLSYTNSGAQNTSQNNTAYTAITLDTDTGSFANGLLTKSSATQFRTDFNGYIRISVKVLAQNTSANDVSWRAAISKNGNPIPHTEIRANGKTNTDRYGSAAGTFMIQCAVNDLFTLGYSNAETTTTNTISINAANHVSMNIHAIYKTS